MLMGLTTWSWIQANRFGFVNFICNFSFSLIIYELSKVDKENTYFKLKLSIVYMYLNFYVNQLLCIIWMVSILCRRIKTSYCFNYLLSTYHRSLTYWTVNHLSWTNLIRTFNLKHIFGTVYSLVHTLEG